MYVCIYKYTKITIDLYPAFMLEIWMLLHFYEVIEETQCNSK